MSTTFQVADIAGKFAGMYFGSDSSSQNIDSLTGTFRSAVSPDEKIEGVDSWVDQHPKGEDLREYLMDLILMQEILAHAGDTDAYFESEEWLSFEERNIDRGSELLNVLVYLTDCRESNVKPDLEDFLYEFLLVEEEDFQDEFFIYEPFIRFAEAIEAGIEAKPQVQLDPESPVKDLFWPISLFFEDPTAGAGKPVKEISALENAILELLRIFYSEFAAS